MSKADVEYQYRILDMALSMFVSAVGGGISRRILYGSGELPPQYDEVISRLVSEGCLEESEYGFHITHKGRTIMEEGGFLRQYGREVRSHRITVIGVVAGVVAAVAALVTLYLQCGCYSIRDPLFSGQVNFIKHSSWSLKKYYFCGE